MKKVVLASMLALASATLCAGPQLYAQDQPGQITIKDPAEYNAYSNAVSQATPQTKAAAVEDFLGKYPQSVVKSEMLEQLMAAYQQTGDLNKTVDAANRLLQVQPNNLRALALSVYIKKAQAISKTNPAEAQPLLDDAANLARRGLNSPRPDNLPQADFDKLKKATTPIFHSAIAASSVGKKDYKTAIAEYRAELDATPVEQTTAGPALNDTYLLGTAYVQQDPKDLPNGIWYLSRAAAYAPEPAKTQIDAAAKYWYNKYHGGMDGYDQVQAQSKATLHPPATFQIVAAPPPPSPQDLASKAIASTPDLKSLALSDKEFILANGKKEDADKLWAVLNGVTTEVPGLVISATPDQVLLAVTEDAKASKTADFTVKMKTPLKDVPSVGATVKLIATFDSYTQTPPMIILRDGELPAAPKAPVRHPAHPPARKPAH